MNTGIHIGTSPEAVEEARESILQILTCGAEQKTIRKALDVFAGVCSVNGASISNCTLQGDTTHHHTHYAEPEPDVAAEMEDDT